MRWMACVFGLVLLAGAQQPANSFRQACLDTDAIAQAGIQPLGPYLQQISALQNPHQLAGAIATLHQYGLTAAFPVGKQPEGLTATALRSSTVHDTAQRLFELLGDPALEAQREANAAINLAVALAVPEQPARQPLDMAAMRRLVPNFDWPVYFQVLGAAPAQGLRTTTAALGALRGQLLIASMDSWKSYLRWRWVEQTAPWLSPPFAELHFAAAGRAQPPRKAFCEQLAGSFAADAYGAVPITRDDFFGDVLRLRAWQVRQEQPGGATPRASAPAVLKFLPVLGGR